MVRLIVACIFGLSIAASAADDKIIVASTTATVEEKPEKLDASSERIAEIHACAKTVVRLYEDLNGRTLAKKFVSRLQEEQSESTLSFNRLLDAKLIRAFCKIRDKKKDNEPISNEAVYEACLIFLNYEEGLILPSCIVEIFRENPETVATIKEILQTAEKNLDKKIEDALPQQVVTKSEP